MGTPFEGKYRYRVRIGYWYVPGTP
ncbi:hypothetical protein A2U01_0090520, partial [Trifolium medium]|nr:hypothetical protein [Trifolium medium]